MARRWRVPVAIGLALAACTIEEVPRPTRVDLNEVAQEEISAALDAYRNALLEGDAAAVAETFLPEGRLHQSDQPDLIGRDQIREAMRRMLADISITDVLLGREQIDIAEGGIAHEFGTFEQTVQTAQQPPIIRRGRYAIRWQRDVEARWLIDRLMLNHLPADTTSTR